MYIFYIITHLTKTPDTTNMDEILFTKLFLVYKILSEVNKFNKILNIINNI